MNAQSGILARLALVEFQVWSDGAERTLVVPSIPLRTEIVQQLDDHRILCGDAQDPESFESLFGGERAQLAFTDPPYNVSIDGHVSGLGQIHHREFAMACGEMSEAEFTGFLATVLGNMAKVSIDGAIHMVCMDWRHMGEILAAGKSAYTELKNLAVWAKDNGGMGSFYRSQHELVFIFKNGTAPHINNFGLGEKGRYRTNVWHYAGVNTLRPGRNAELALHPTPKPVVMVADAIKDCSKRSGIVLYAFGGSGTTLIAAHKTGRRRGRTSTHPQARERRCRPIQFLDGRKGCLGGLIPVRSRGKQEVEEGRGLATSHPQRRFLAASDKDPVTCAESLRPPHRPRPPSIPRCRDRCARAG